MKRTGFSLVTHSSGKLLNDNVRINKEFENI